MSVPVPPPDRRNLKIYGAVALALALWVIRGAITTIRTGVFRHKGWELTGRAAVIDGWLMLAIGSAGLAVVIWRFLRLYRRPRRDQTKIT